MERNRKYIKVLSLFRCVSVLGIIIAISGVEPGNAEQQPQDQRTMSTPKADCEALMNAVLPFAEKMLAAHGEFIPLGVAMRSGGQIVSIAGYDGNEHPKSVDVMALMKEGIREAARRGEYKAAAIVYEVRVKLPTTGEPADAIAVSLSHRDNYSVIVLFPYKLDDGKVVFETAFAQKGETDLFVPR